MIKICLRCNKEYKPTRGAKQKYCSKSCASRHDWSSSDISKKDAPPWVIKKIVSRGKYNYAIVPEHPNCTRNCYVMEHRVVVENNLGRLLLPNEVVHHRDGNPKNNSFENLQVMTQSEHVLLHLNGFIVTLLCPGCNCIFEKIRSRTHLGTGRLFTACSRTCAGKINRFIQTHGETPQMFIENVISIRKCG